MGVTNMWYAFIYSMLVMFGYAQPITVGTCLRQDGGDMTVKVTAINKYTFRVRMVQSVSFSGKTVYSLNKTEWNYGPDLKYMRPCQCPQREIHTHMDKGIPWIPVDSIFK